METVYLVYLLSDEGGNYLMSIHSNYEFANQEADRLNQENSYQHYFVEPKDLEN